MSIIIPANSASAAGGYQVDNSCRFDDGSSAYMHRTPNAGNRRTMTLSVWLKGSSLADGSNNVLGQYNSSNANNAMLLVIEDNGKIMVWNYTTSAYTMDIRTNRLLRDNSAWYHIVVAVDTTQSTASNRVKVYVNGVQETSFSNETYPSQNLELFLNQGVAQNIGTQRYGSTVGSPFDGYMAEFCFIDGTQNAVTDFGEFDEDSGIWKPIDVSGLTFGTNGYYLDFEDSSALGNDVSGNDNDFTTVNLAAIDQSTDTCTNNFSTFNGSLKQMSTMVLSEGNLQGATSSSHEAFFGSFFSSIGVTTGKWYAEFKCTGNANRVYVGISNNLEEDVHGSTTVGGKKAFTFAYKGNGWAYYGADGKIAHTNSDTFLSYGAALSNNDIVGVALDLDELEIYFSINGSFQNSGDPTSGSSQTGGVVTAGGAALTTGANSGTYYFCVSDNDQSTVCTVQANFGSPIHSISSGNADGNGFGNFEYAVPSGYLALCTKNLAENG